MSSGNVSGLSWAIVANWSIDIKESPFISAPLNLTFRLTSIGVEEAEWHGCLQVASIASELSAACMPGFPLQSGHTSITVNVGESSQSSDQDTSLRILLRPSD